MNKTCIKCKEEKPLGRFELRKDTGTYRGSCKDCENIKSKLYSMKNPERRKETMKKYLLKNPEERKATMKRYYEKNKEEIFEKQREGFKDKSSPYYKAYLRYYKKNKEHVLNRCKEYRDKNKDRYKQWREAWRKTERGNIMSRIHVFSRSLRTALTDDGTVTLELITSLLISQDYKCAITGESLKDNGYHIDHIYPLSKGGQHISSNIQLLTPFANLSKGAKILQ